MGDENSLQGRTQAHKHSAPSSDGGFLETTVTGVTNLSQGSIAYANASEIVTELIGGTSGDVLTANGAGVAPSYQALPPAGGDANFIVSSFQILPFTSAISNRYGALWQQDFHTANSNDGLVSIPLNFAWELNAIEFCNKTNTNQGDAIFYFRDDGSSIASVTVPHTTTGKFSAGALTVAVASGSECNWLIDNSATIFGTLSPFIYMVAYGKST